MKKGQNTRGYQRYMALDIHRKYLLVGAQNEEKEWVLAPRRVGLEKFAEWAKKNIRAGDIVVLETTTNVWTIYDSVAPLASRVLVANAAGVDKTPRAGFCSGVDKARKCHRIPTVLCTLCWAAGYRRPY